MTINEPLELMGAGVAGLALGAIFFGGLWWTVRGCTTTRHPALWFAGSLLLRVVLVLVGFYLVAGPRWERLLLCLLGFAVVRLVATRLMRSPGTAPIQDGSPAVEETGHAP